MSGEVINLAEAKGRYLDAKKSPAVKLRDDAWFAFFLPDGSKLRSLDVPEMRVIHWVGEELWTGGVRDIETDIASLGYKVEEELALPPNFVDCLVPFEHAVRPGGVDKYLLRKQFYAYLNQGLVELDAKFQVENNWRIEVHTQNIMYMHYDRAEVLSLK